MRTNDNQSLPVDKILPEIAERIRNQKQQIVIRATPGSGKTTRIPPFLLDVLPNQILVLEPRRLAAKLSAERVQSELREKNSPHADEVGWQMRDDVKLSSKTRLVFLTEGMFPLRLMQSPNLEDVSCVILDEFHERHAQTDLAFALVRKLQETSRPDLILIVMSATLDISRLQAILPDAAVIDIEAPIYPLEIQWWKGDFNKSISEKVVEAVTNISSNAKYPGHILVFLPGTREIVFCAEALQRFSYLRKDANNWDVIELRATLAKELQNQAFQNTGRRKIILATNVAESSVTIPGVTCVVDSGLARVPNFSVWSQMTTLETRPVSQASVIQRSGRAARTAPGIVLRLFSEQDFAGRPQADLPEIQRSDLAGFLFSLWNIRDRTHSKWTPDALSWPDPPDPIAWNQAQELLINLKLIVPISDGDNSKKGTDFRVSSKQYAQWPLHPRVIRFLISCLEDGMTSDGVYLAAMLADEQSRITTPASSHALGCDLLARYEIIRKNFDDPRWQNIGRTARQLMALLNIPKSALSAIEKLNLDKPLLDAYWDRVSRARKPFHANSPREYSLTMGGDAQLTETSAAITGDWIISWSLNTVKSTGSAKAIMGDKQKATALLPSIEGASQIDLETLLKFDAPLKSVKNQVIWDEGAQKVRHVERIQYGNLLLSEKRIETSTNEGTELLTKKLTELWPKPFPNDVDLRCFIARQSLLFENGLIDYVWDFEELKSLLIATMSDGIDSFSEITQRSLAEWIRDCIGLNEWQEVEKLAPREIKIGAGFMTRIQYEKGKTPWMEARLQNFYGQTMTPKVLGGKLPITLHLLAPNQVALQVTSDLENFWKSTYPSLRNEYMRKYPRHVWAENPIEAEPPARGSLKPKKK